MPRRRSVRAVHTSDVHLGSSHGGHRNGLAESEATLAEQAFMRVIDLANDVDADLLLIAGDFFDHDRVHEETVFFAGREIDRFRGKTVICPGNHDAIDEGRLYWRYDLEAMATRLRIIREPMGEVVELPDLDLVVWGRAYRDADWKFRPLEGIPERIDHRWHVAMAHGHLVRGEHDRHRSMLIEEHELHAAAPHWDYLALGHWDPHTNISTGGLNAVYSGSPLGFGGENTVAGWANVVDFDEDGVRWQPRRVDPRDRRG